MEPLMFWEFLPFGVNDVLVVVKLFYLLGLLIYLIFAGVVIRQVEMMMAALGGLLQLPIRFTAWFHLILVLVVFVMAMVIL